jgi:hypothetical protein
MEKTPRVWGKNFPLRLRDRMVTLSQLRPFPCLGQVIRFLPECLYGCKSLLLFFLYTHTSIYPSTHLSIHPPSHLSSYSTIYSLTGPTLHQVLEIQEGYTMVAGLCGLSFGPKLPLSLSYFPEPRSPSVLMWGTRLQPRRSVIE